MPNQDLNLKFNWDLDYSSIFVKKILRITDKLVNIISWLFFIGGLLALGYWYYIIILSGINDVEQLFFWQTQHILIFVFWFGILNGLYLFYRHSWLDSKKNNFPRKMHQNFDISGKIPFEIHIILETAFNLAVKNKSRAIDPVHILAALIMKDKKTGALFSRLNIDLGILAQNFRNRLNIVDNSLNSRRLGLSKTTTEAIIEAYQEAYYGKQKKLKTIDLIVPCLKREAYITEALYDLEINLDKITDVVAWFRINDLLLEKYQLYKKMAQYKPDSAMNKAYTAVATVLLNSLSYDWTLAAKWGRVDLCVGRDKELDNLFSILESGQAGAIFVGPNGVGKDSLIGGLAQLMVEENVPLFLQDKRLLELDLTRLIGGVDPAQAQERLIDILNEAGESGNVVFYIKNLEMMLGITSGSQESLDLAGVLADAINRRSIFCLASCTPENYAKYIEGSSLANAMVKIEINEPDIHQTLQVIESKIANLEGQYDVYFSYQALADVIELTNKYIHDKFQPAKSLEILELVAAKANKTQKQDYVNRNDIAEVLSDIIHIPISKISESESNALMNLEDKIHERMIGQEEAIDLIAASLRRARVELREGKRPISSFLFLGPTGVGKTELAKTVAEVYFGQEDCMIRIDMSEYQQQDSINKMIGDTNGGSGYLTEAVRKKPFALILLDEIEKAHPDILNLFLQVMDDGRLTDAQGRTIDFTNSIIIATSNAGALYIQEQVRAGAKTEAIKQELINNHLTKVMRPELMNRFDGIIVFKPLTPDNIIAITGLILKKTAKLLELKGIELEITEAGQKEIAIAGYEPEFGARPLRRLIQDKIETPIAEMLLSGQLSRRDKIIVNSITDLKIEKAKKL